MAKKRKTAPAPTAATVSGERAGRLFRLLTFLGEGPQTRAVLMRKLHLGIRGFYRDLEALRSVGIGVDLANHRYTLHGDLTKAIASLPFPDPCLTLGEARALAKGRTSAHRKLKEQIAQIEQ